MPCTRCADRRPLYTPKCNPNDEKTPDPLFPGGVRRRTRTIPSARRFRIRRGRGARRNGVAGARTPRTEQGAAACLVLHLPRQGKRARPAARKGRILPPARRRMEIPLGRKSRRAPREVLRTRIRRLRMGRRDGAHAVERRRNSEGRIPPLRRADLRKPARDLRAPGRRGRLARRRHAHPAPGLGDLQAPQRGGIIPPHLHPSGGLGRPRGLCRLRRRVVVLLPLGQWPLRRVLEEFAQHRVV